MFAAKPVNASFVELYYLQFHSTRALSSNATTSALLPFALLSIDWIKNNARVRHLEVLEQP